MLIGIIITVVLGGVALYQTFAARAYADAAKLYAETARVYRVCAESSDAKHEETHVKLKETQAVQLALLTGLNRMIVAVNARDSDEMILALGDMSKAAMEHMKARAS